MELLNVNKVKQKLKVLKYKIILTSGMITARVSAGLSGQEKKKCLWVGFDESVPIEFMSIAHILKKQHKFHFLLLVRLLEYSFNISHTLIMMKTKDTTASGGKLTDKIFLLPETPDHGKYTDAARIEEEK